MNQHRENIIKGYCFKSATQIYTRMMQDGIAKEITDHDATVIYSIAIKLWKNGKERYWKSPYPQNQISYKSQVLKRIYLWLKASFWEKRIEK